MFTRLVRQLSTFAEGDIVVIRPLKAISSSHLSKPLRKGFVSHTHLGEIHHDDILGQPKRVFLPYKGLKKAKNQKYTRYVVTEPTLEEYTSMIRRQAQPIYTMDANAIVSLADIDVECPNNTSEIEQKHFLEAGTGNGSLTLSICHAIHGANGVARYLQNPQLRGAILHSIDRKDDHLKLGQSNVIGYKRGKFAGDVEFSLKSSPSEFLEENPHLTLSGVFLDLPEPHEYLATLAPKLTPEGTIVVFCPSITQILRCRETLADGRMNSQPIDLQLVKTVELPPGNGGGTREWDVHTAFTRETGEKVSVCRPKVGARVVGGGFVGVFKRSTVVGQAVVDLVNEKQEIDEETDENKSEI